MIPLTIYELYKACTENRFILGRFYDNTLVGINCKVAKIGCLKQNVFDNPNGYTSYDSYIPCSFNEYVTHKTPFILTKKD